MKNIEFVNAQEMAKDYPTTFDAPTKEELDKIKEGDYVKICDNKERFWVIVEEVDGDIITGEVDNLLIGDQNFNLGDSIEFKKENIYDITYKS